MVLATFTVTFPTIHYHFSHFNMSLSPQMKNVSPLTLFINLDINPYLCTNFFQCLIKARS